MVISDAVLTAASSLDENARFEAELIVMKVLGISRTELVLGGRNEISDGHMREVEELAKRRLTGEPLQYILGECEFMSLNFQVEQGVLIPRSDSEILAETVIENCGEGMKILDICSGSGCIGISVAHYVKDAVVDMIDISDKAIYICGKNIELNGVADRVKVKKMDILNEYPAERYDIAVSNPPYIETEIIDTLQTEVKDYEPHIALDGGCDGLVFYRRIIDTAPQYLKTNGLLAFEIGYNQGEAVTSMMNKEFENVKLIKDLCGNDRVVIGRLR